MGKDITYTCDRCGDKIDYAQYFKGNTLSIKLKSKKVMICSLCSNDFERFLTEKKSGFSKVASFIKKNI